MPLFSKCKYFTTTLQQLCYRLNDWIRQTRTCSECPNSLMSRISVQKKWDFLCAYVNHSQYAITSIIKSYIVSYYPIICMVCNILPIITNTYRLCVIFVFPICCEHRPLTSEQRERHDWGLSLVLCCHLLSEVWFSAPNVQIDNLCKSRTHLNRHSICQETDWTFSSSRAVCYW